MIDICEHHVFTIFTAAPWDYLAYALHREVHQLPGVGRHEAELDAILRRHFTIIEPAAFAISQDARDRAKREITRFLTERNFRL